MTGRLEGKVALVTGAAQGHGLAEARAFAAEGAIVVLADVAVEAGAAAAADIGGTAEFAALDVSDEAAWRSVVDGIVARHGRLDVLLNNAARYRTGPLLDESPQSLARLADVNLYGPFLGIQAVAKPMTAGGGGSIINVSSTAGLTGYAGHGAYGLSKWALRGLTRVAAVELAPLGIRVTCLIPGAVAGPMLESNVPPEVLADPAHWAGTPLARAGRPEEVARAAVFLASDDSSYVTATELVVDGGSTGTG
ncbi:SDR family NAD(P)-dependent oxidoreductase [Pseudonocardia lutea]|uniref:SDR family NAD(P)-dependent oxidoreductase n=1 Tax=Pseudonocardia lutea TaxID=2172015 RepID=A0ABW1ICB5_9PSEU